MQRHLYTRVTDQGGKLWAQGLTCICRRSSDRFVMNLVFPLVGRSGAVICRYGLVDQP